MVDIQAYALNDELFVSTTGQSGYTIGIKSIFKPFFTRILRKTSRFKRVRNRFLSNYELTAAISSDGPVMGQYVLSVGYLSVPS